MIGINDRPPILPPPMGMSFGPFHDRASSSQFMMPGITPLPNFNTAAAKLLLQQQQDAVFMQIQLQNLFCGLSK